MNYYQAMVKIAEGTKTTIEQIQKDANITEYDLDYEQINIVSKLATYFDIPESVVILLSIEEKDIGEDKKEIFKTLNPPIEELLFSILEKNKHHGNEKENMQTVKRNCCWN